jgi:predicted nucleic acid-binding protein
MTIYGLETSFLVAYEVSRHAFHRRARSCCDKLSTRGRPVGFGAAVLTEFIHVVTDERRFAVPLSIEGAIARASTWWGAEEVLPVYPGSETTRLFLSWLMQFRLGRKRLLDTLLAATWREAGVTQILTLNWLHFQVYGLFHRRVCRVKLAPSECFQIASGEDLVQLGVLSRRLLEFRLRFQSAAAFLPKRRTSANAER